MLLGRQTINIHCFADEQAQSLNTAHPRLPNQQRAEEESFRYQDASTPYLAKCGFWPALLRHQMGFLAKASLRHYLSGLSFSLPGGGGKGLRITWYLADPYAQANVTGLFLHVFPCSPPHHGLFSQSKRTTIWATVQTLVGWAQAAFEGRCGI